MEVTITNEGGRITISDTRDPAFSSDWNELKDGIDLLQFGDAVRIIFKDGRRFESLASETEVVGFSGSTTPSDGIELYAALWDVLADYGSGGGGGGSGTVTSVSALTIGTSGTDLSSSVANSTTTPVITLNVPTASATKRGALSSSDWSTFNGKQDSLGFTPENVANKSTSVASDSTSNTKYPSVKAVFDWASSVFTTTAAVASQITTALTGYATQTWVNAQGFLTAITSGQITTALGYTPPPNTRAINTTSPLTGGGNLTADRTIAIPVATSSSDGYLSSTDWATFNSKQTALGVPYMTMQESYAVATNQTGITYVASANKLYVCNFSSNSVSILDTTTGATLATLSVTGAFQPFYIASIGEVWITSTSLTTINRISVSGNNLLTAITGATANGADFIEYSSTKVFICCNNASGSIMVVNPSTLSVSATITTSVPANPQGMALNTNVASSQYDKIIIAAAAGVAILNPSTNAISTTLANPSSSISTGSRIRYISSTNQYAVASFSNNSVIILDVASATTFTLNSTIRGLSAVLDVAVDETKGYIFAAFMGLTSSTVLFASIIDLTTKKVVSTLSTNVISGSASTSGRIALDQSNNRFFLCGRSGVANVTTSIKYV